MLVGIIDPIGQRVVSYDHDLDDTAFRVLVCRIGNADGISAYSRDRSS